MAWRILRLCLMSMLVALPVTLAQSTVNGVRYVTYQNPDGTTEYLEDNRKPSLYTQNFGDCLGNSAINVTRFDAAYYQDNMTVLFHLAGNSALQNISVMMYIGVFAYGENRFDLTFDPCGANIYSMCPLNKSVPITANGIIPVSPSDVANIPDIALSIPDFEGQAILRIFANDTQSEIGCYSAVVTNGASFSQPAGLGTTLGIFTLVAMIASFATAAYGEAVPTMRLHYAHSLSVGVVFAVWQHIFYTGALSMNWPSVLVAWWSNFAWAGGMIYTDSMQASINRLIGNYVGDTLSVGAAAAGTAQPNLGGGYDIHAIYGRGLSQPDLPANHPLLRNLAGDIYGRALDPVSPEGIQQKLFERSIRARDTLASAATGYKWYGQPVGAGLPLPGNFSGFAGTLAEENLRISNAFMTGFLWFLILLLIVIGLVIMFKGILELFARRTWMPQTRLAFFRTHWKTYLLGAVLRTCFIAWFMIMFLAIFQFTQQSPASVKAIAAIVFVVFLVGMSAIAALACLYKAKREGPTEKSSKGVLNSIPFLRRRPQHVTEIEMQGQYRPESKSSSRPFWRRASSHMSIDAPAPGQYSIHDDEDYIMKYGWLASRFRRSKWWFFTFWLFYEFARACFYGAASGHALVQVFGLLVVEILAFVFVLWAKPFEGRRLNVIVVYCLGFSKVTTVALSSAFDVQFNLQRIITTAIGIVIIVIQGILMIITCVAIVAGAITSYMSVSRNTENFKPRSWARRREKYFDHLDRTVNDLPAEPKPKPPPKPPKKAPEPELPVEPYFEVKTMRRVAKIDDDDDTEIAVMDDDNRSMQPFPMFSDSRPDSRNASIGPSRRRTSSAGSHGGLPFGARPHKRSWSMKDYEMDGDRGNATPVDMSRSLPEDASNAAPTAPRLTHSRTNSRGSTNSQHRAVRRQADNNDLRIGAEHDRKIAVPTPSRTRSRNGSHGSSGRVTPTNDYLGDQRQTRLPMLTPAQESEEFNGSYFEQIR